MPRFDSDHDGYLDPPLQFRTVFDGREFVRPQCEVCGRDSDWRLCSRCEQDFVKEMEQR